MRQGHWQEHLARAWDKGMGLEHWQGHVMWQGHGISVLTREGAWDYGTRAWYKAWVKGLWDKDKGQGMGQRHLGIGQRHGTRASAQVP